MLYIKYIAHHISNIKTIFSNKSFYLYIYKMKYKINYSIGGSLQSNEEMV